MITKNAKSPSAEIAIQGGSAEEQATLRATLSQWPEHIRNLIAAQNVMLKIGTYAPDHKGYDVNEKEAYIDRGLIGFSASKEQTFNSQVMLFDALLCAIGDALPPVDWQKASNEIRTFSMKVVKPIERSILDPATIMLNAAININHQGAASDFRKQCPTAYGAYEYLNAVSSWPVADIQMVQANGVKFTISDSPHTSADLKTRTVHMSRSQPSANNEHADDLLLDSARLAACADRLEGVNWEKAWQEFTAYGVNYVGILAISKQSNDKELMLRLTQSYLEHDLDNKEAAEKARVYRTRCELHPIVRPASGVI